MAAPRLQPRQDRFERIEPRPERVGVGIEFVPEVLDKGGDVEGQGLLRCYGGGLSQTELPFALITAPSGTSDFEISRTHVAS
jgi:hypothetical protein